MSDVDDLDFTPEGIERLIVASADHLDDWYADRGITTTRRKYRDALAASESIVAAMRAERDTYQWADQKHSAQLVEATELVDALRAEVERLTKALEPFAAFANLSSADCLPNDWPLTQGSGLAARQVTVGDFRRAARALDRSPSVEPGK